MDQMLRILNLEDEPVDSELISELLNADGLAVVIDRVDTLEGFQAALEQGSYALILSDYTIPGMDSLEALRLARRIQPEVPYIFLSGTMGEEQAIETLKMGASDYVLKQRIGRLAPSVRRALQEAEEQSRRRRAETALRESEERLRLALWGAGQGIWDWDLKAKVLRWDDRCKEIFSLPPWAPVTFEWFLNVLHPDDRERVSGSYAAALRDRTDFREEYRTNPPGGAMRWVLARGRGYYDEQGEPYRMSGTVLDITKRKEMEEEVRRARDELEIRVRERTAELLEANEALRSSEEHLKRTFEQAPIGAAIVALDYRFQRVNDALCRITGYSKDELTGLTFTDITHPDDLDADLELAKRLTSGEIDQYDLDKRYITKEGKTVWVHLSARMLRDAAGNPLYYIPMMEDITERKRAEESLQAYTTKLEESNKVLQDFTFIASHDLQEPLRKIRSFGLRLKDRYAETLGENGKDYLERMLNAGERMQTLLKALLEYSRVTTKAEPCVAVDLRKVVQEVLNDMEVRIMETGGAVQVGELPTIEADPNQMRQLFQNLIGNALKYHGEESPIIEVYGEPAEARNWNIFVKDNGIGFEEKYLERIFAPFQRLHGRSEFEGAGMGLAICKKIVERHRGSMTAESTPGQGATFIVTLPTRKPAGGIACETQ